MGRFLIGILALASACVSAGYAGDEQLEPKSKALAHYIMAVACDLQGQTADAIREYEHAVAFNPAEPLPHLRLAAYDIRNGRLDKAVAQLKTVLNLSPQNFQAHYLLALVYSTQRKYDLAALEYEGILKTASKNDPDNLEIYTYLAQLYFSQNKYTEAIAQFNHIIELQPDNVSANYLLGSAYLEIKQYSKAKALFQKVLTLEPGQDGALNSLAYMYAQDGTNLDEALKMVRKAVAIDSSNGAYYDTLGWVLFKKGMNTEALMALQKAEVYVQDPVVYDHMGDVYKTIGESAMARKFWRKSLDLDPHQPQLQEKIEGLEKTQAQKAQAFKNQL